MTDNQNNDFTILLRSLNESLESKNATETKRILHHINTEYSDWKSWSQIADLYNEHLPRCLNDVQDIPMQELLFADILDINRIQEVELKTNVNESCTQNFQAVPIHIKIKILELLAFYGQTVNTISTGDLRAIVSWYNSANDDDIDLFNSQILIYEQLVHKQEFMVVLIENIIHCVTQEINPRSTFAIIDRFNLLERMSLYKQQLKVHHTISTHYILFMLYDTNNNNKVNPIYSDNGRFNNNTGAIAIQFPVINVG